MKTYFFTVQYAHWRTGEVIAMSAGMVKADDEAKATEIINKKINNEYAFALKVWEVQENYFEYYIPK